MGRERVTIPPVAAGQSTGSTTVNTQGPFLGGWGTGMLLEELSTLELSPRANCLSLNTCLSFRNFKKVKKHSSAPWFNSEGSIQYNNWYLAVGNG